MMSKFNSEYIDILLEGEHDPSLLRYLQASCHIRTELKKRKYPFRVDLSWHYTSSAKGLPDDATAEEMELFITALQPAMESNKLALLAYTLTGEGVKLWSFYTRNIEVFQQVLNDSTSMLPLFPIEIYVEEDIEGEAFAEVEALIPYIQTD